MRIAVIGKTGQVARALQECAAARDDLTVHALGRPELDLTRPETIATAIERLAPDLVVNAAAYNAVDRAESEPDVSYAVNGTGPGAIAAAASGLQVPVIHFSTDYVFDGGKGSAYTEADVPSPLGVYARSKLDGERRVAAANDRHVILRTAWVFSPFGQNFVDLMLRLATQRDRLQVVADQTGCPTYAPDIADAVLKLAARITGADAGGQLFGVYHLAGPDAVTRYEFARRIFAASASRGGPQPMVEPVPGSHFPAPAPRPINSSLDSSRITATFGVALPGLDDALARCMERVFASTPHPLDQGSRR
jgi:dTDP-4-dehydrorhamnose reductase